jgi:hypothetical protein
MTRDGAMTKPLRSPVVGYNHNLRYRGRLFHVQTEDSGPVNPHVFTHLFYEGTILSSKKLQYSAESHEDAVKVQMQQLHKSMMRELTAGDHDQRVTAFFAARGQEAFSEPPPSRPQAPAAAAPAAAAAPPPAAQVVTGELFAAPVGAPAPALGVPVVQVSGVVAGSIDNGGARRPAPAAIPPGAKATPRPVVMVKPTAMKRPPMVFSSSADGVVVQRSVVVAVGSPQPGAPQAQVSSEPTARIRPAAVVGEPTGQAPPPHASQATMADAAPIARGRAPSGGENAFSDLVSDKSLDEVILEYLSDDNEPPERR